MKKIILTPIFVLLINFAFGQGLDELKNSFNNYIKLIEDKELTKTVDHIYPELFNITPKETILKSLNAAQNDTTKTINFHSSKADKYSTFINIDSIIYCFIEYSYKLDTKIDIEEDEESLSYMSREEQIKLDLSIWKQKFGRRNVKYNKDDLSIKINANSVILGIYNPKFKSWKYLEAKPKFKRVYKGILPKIILKKI